jgi:hypothetical protein
MSSFPDFEKPEGSDPHFSQLAIPCAGTGEARILEADGQ